MNIVIIGRRWFDKINGNSYHSAEIVIDGNMVGKVDITYGYGDQYVQTAFEFLEKNDLIPLREAYDNGGHEAIWQWKERNKIAVHSTVADVGRKKDL